MDLYRISKKFAKNFNKYGRILFIQALFGAPYNILDLMFLFSIFHLKHPKADETDLLQYFMNPYYVAYNFFGTGLFFLLFPPFFFYSSITGRHRKGLSQRLGIYPKIRFFQAGSPRIWIHAVSVGEVHVAFAIMNALIDILPAPNFILSTTTEYGMHLAKRKLQGSRFQNMTDCLFAPVDFILSARSALRTVRPDVLAFIETELWPNWIAEASRMGIKTALLNGRISIRSIKGYLKILPLMKDTLNRIDAFSMIREADAKRIQQMGAPLNRIRINGNAKYDLLAEEADPTIANAMANIYNLRGDEKVFIAGSTRREEERMVLEAFEKIRGSFPNALLVIAPRHIKRSRFIADLVKHKDLSYQFRTDFDGKESKRHAPVVIMDTMGELQAVYSIGTIIFCGGSLVPLGGQNILEAAVWGKPVLYGPSMDDFLDAKEILDQIGGGITVCDEKDLVEKTLHLLHHPLEIERMGTLARQAALQNQGSAMKHAAVIRDLLINSRSCGAVRS
jgi:3-deoxy-D-manno-octulosonic-acid transferase